MKIAIDTNIVLRTASGADPDHARVRTFVEQLAARGDDLFIAPKVLFEYWVVITRPLEVNGFGLSPVEARMSVENALRTFQLLPDPGNLVFT